MKKAAYNIVPTTEEVLKTMGEQIKLARLLLLGIEEENDYGHRILLYS